MRWFRTIPAQLALVGWASVALGGEIQPRIVNGIFESGEPSTGALLFGTNPDTASVRCSGTLIGCETFLTAAHCVCDRNGQSCTGAGSPDPGDFSVFLQHAGFFNVSSIILRSDYNFPVADVALLKLSTPVHGVAPTPINTFGTPAPGIPGRIVGFGRSGGGNQDFGLKRSGAVIITTCTGGISNNTSVCWRFENPLGDPGDDSNTCNGDSGGPLFVDFGNGPLVAGVTSGGNRTNCLPTDESFDANVSFYSSYLQSEGGADLGNTSCGCLPSAGTPEAPIQAAVGTLSAATPQELHTFSVPSGTAAFRVAMNAEEPSNFNLYVRAGSEPTLSNFDCARTGSGQLGFCEFLWPGVGDWFVLIDRVSGSGTYQVVSTTFGSSAEGEDCDDGDSCTSTDTCQSGVCAGSPLPEGSSCDDGSLCTRDETCQSGICTPPSPFVSGCRRPTVPERSRLVLVDKDADKKDRLVWRWSKGEATAIEDFGDPTASTDYALCIYDEAGDAPQLVSETLVPAGPNWELRTRGYLYRDPSRLNGGVRRLMLKRGAEGKAQVVVRARGQHVQMPLLGLAQDPVVTVQLVSENACWEAQYTTNVRNDPVRFEARSD